MQASSAHLTELIKTKLNNIKTGYPSPVLWNLPLHTSIRLLQRAAIKSVRTATSLLPPPSPPYSDKPLPNNAELLPQTAGNIYEFGAGTGHLAATLLQNLSDGLNHYYIIELSAELAENNANIFLSTHLPKQPQKSSTSPLPEHFEGIIIGNEVLDAMPVERLIYQNEGFQQIGVSLENDELIEAIRPLTQAELSQTAALSSSPSFIHKRATSCTICLYPNLAAKLQRGGMILSITASMPLSIHPQRRRHIYRPLSPSHYPTHFSISA